MSPEPPSLDGRVLYIYKDDLNRAQGYQSILENVRLNVDLKTLDNLEIDDIGNYDLILVGPDTDSDSSHGRA